MYELVLVILTKFQIDLIVSCLTTTLIFAFVFYMLFAGVGVGYSKDLVKSY